MKRRKVIMLSLVLLFIFFISFDGYPDVIVPYDIRLDTGDTLGASNSEESSISNDGNGRIYVTWQDERNGNTDIYFNYSHDNGVTWQASDIRLDIGDTPGASDSANPTISSNDNGHVYVTWQDGRNGNANIYFNYSHDNGVTWQTSDIKLDTGDTPGARDSANPTISSDDNGHVYVTWQDNVNYDIYFNYSNDSGVTWQTSDIRLDSNAISWEPYINSDSNGHVYVTWQKWQNGIYFNFSSDYGATWQISEIRLDTGVNPEEPMISSDDNGHVYVTWWDFRNGKPDIYFNYSSDYGVTWQASDIRLDTGDTPGTGDSLVPRISSDDNGHVYVTWWDFRNGRDDIYFNYSSDYGVTWQTSDIRLDSGDTPDASASDEEGPKISSDGNGGVYVIWEDGRNGKPDIYFNYSSDNGVTWQTSDIRLDSGDTPGASDSEYPAISSDGNGRVYVTWQDFRNGQTDIYFNSLYISDPTPDIKANGSDVPVGINTIENLSVTVELDSGGNSGDNADWWVVADTPFGWFYYDVPRGSWLPGLIVTFQGPLFNLTPPFTVLSMSGLPPGMYTFYFGVDMVMNGSLDMGSIYYDSVVVNITE